VEHHNLGSAGCQPVCLGSLPGREIWADVKLVCAKMLPAGLPATTGWQPVLPRKNALATLRAIDHLEQGNVCAC
jgi:hypothetical protein